MILSFGFFKSDYYYYLFFLNIFHNILSFPFITVFDLISVLFAYVILGQKNRPN